MRKNIIFVKGNSGYVEQAGTTAYEAFELMEDFGELDVLSAAQTALMLNLQDPDGGAVWIELEPESGWIEIMQVVPFWKFDVRVYA